MIYITTLCKLGDTTQILYMLGNCTTKTKDMAFYYYAYNLLSLTYDSILYLTLTSCRSSFYGWMDGVIRGSNGARLGGV
jgi:hypothetical protein